MPVARDAVRESWQLVRRADGGWRHRLRDLAAGGLVALSARAVLSAWGPRWALVYGVVATLAVGFAFSFWLLRRIERQRRPAMSSGHGQAPEPA